LSHAKDLGQPSPGESPGVISSRTQQSRDNLNHGLKSVEEEAENQSSTMNG
jgi:hypothetical protein